MPQAVTVRAISAIPLAQRSRAICRSPPVCCARVTQKRCVPDHHVSLYVVNNLQLTIVIGSLHSGHMSERPTSIWTPTGGAFWADEWQPLGASLDVLDPEDGTTVGTVSDCSAADVDAAVTAVARSVLDGADWPVWQRREALHRAAALLVQRREVFAELISREGCKPRSRRRPRGAASRRDGPPVGRAGPSPGGSHAPLRRHPPGRGTHWLVHPGTGRCHRRDHALQRPAQPGSAQAGARADRGERRRAQARRAHSPDSPGIHRPPARGGSPDRSDRRASGPGCDGRCRAGWSPARRHGFVHRRLRHWQRSGSCCRSQEDVDGARRERCGHRPARRGRRACGSRRGRRRVRGGGPELPVRAAGVRRTSAVRPDGANSSSSAPSALSSAARPTPQPIWGR